MLDVVKFDDWLREKHGDYDRKEPKSMREFIQEQYGDEAVAFVLKFIGNQNQ